MCFPEWESSALTVDLATEPAPVPTAVDSFVAAEDIKQESEMSTTNAVVDLYGVVMLFASAANTRRRNTSATKSFMFNWAQVLIQMFDKMTKLKWKELYFIPSRLCSKILKFSKFG